MMAEGARPERNSGNASDAVSATSTKSHTIARPRPNPSASPCTSATLIIGELRSACLNSMSRAASLRMDSASRPARSRPVQNILPRARIRRTRATGFAASERSSASMASNIAPVTSFPWLGLSSVNERTSGIRWITTPVPGDGLEGADGPGEAMRGTLYKDGRPVNRRDAAGSSRGPTPVSLRL